MSVPVEVVVHDVKEATILPKPVAEIVARWTQPLPKALSSDVVQEVLSPGAKEMYAEAIVSPSYVLEEEDSLVRPGRPVSDLVDTTLSYVRMAKAAQAFPDGHQQARRNWTSLLAAIGCAMVEDVYISEDVRFLKPRTHTQPQIQELSDLEGKATILLSCAVCARVCPDVSDGTGKKGVPNSSYNLPYSSMPPKEEEKELGFSSLDVPFNAHVLSGRGKRVSCLLPVVCVADEDEIEALVTSVVCQRHVWNMETPVVGISLSSSNTTATVIIGWMNENENATPIVHILVSPEVNHAGGRFHLLDAASALRFSQFILDLQPHFTSVKNALQTHKTKDFSWRLDCINLQDKPISWPEQEDGLKAWIDNSDCDSRVEIPEPPPIIETDLIMPPSLTVDVGSGPDAALDNELLQTPQSETAPSSASSSSSKRVPKEYYTASAFADLHPRDGLRKKAAGLETWLWDRRVILLMRIKIENPVTDLAVQSNSMMDLYAEMTVFRWPKSWKTVDEVTKCDIPLDYLRKNLFEDYKACQINLSSNDHKDDKEWDEVFQSISNHMSTLLFAVAQARAVEEQSTLGVAPEAAARSAWDALMNVMCCPAKEALSTTFLVERAIQLPKNKAVEMGYDFPAIQQARLQFDLIKSQEFPVEHLGVYFDAVRLLSNAAQNIDAVKDGYHVTTEQRAHEPCDAIVDGVYCIDYALRHQVVQVPSVGTSTAPSTMRPRWPWVSSLMKFFHKNDPRDKPEATEHACQYPDGKKAKQDGSTHDRCVVCPAITENLPKGKSLPPITKLPADCTKLFVPFIFTEYKRKGMKQHQAFHQMEMYCISGVEALAALGITDFPIWGVIAVGTVGYILMAWKSTKSAKNVPQGTNPTSSAPSTEGYNVLIDRNLKSFNLTRPLEAFHFATSVHRVYKHHEKLRKKLQEVDLNSILESPFQQEWMMTEKKPKPKTTSPQVDSQPQQSPSPIPSPVHSIPEIIVSEPKTRRAATI